MNTIWISCDYGVFNSINGKYTLTHEGIQLKLFRSEIFIPMSKISFVGHTTKIDFDSNTEKDCYEIFLKITEHEFNNLCALLYYEDEIEPHRR